MGLKLGITPNVTNPSELTMEFLNSSANSCTLGTYTLTLVDLNFNKQMYQPCEINALIQISVVGNNSISVSELQQYFLKTEVSLSDTESSSTIASGYYVHELVFGKTTLGLQPSSDGSSSSLITKVYAQFKIFSPDKLLTLDRRSRAFTAKRLVQDILTTEVDTITLPYDPSQKLQVDTQFENKLYQPVYKKGDDYVLEKSGDPVHIDGCIHPYLVQYDESFYDMLIRTANRWGEFVYFEGGKLILGRKSDQEGDPPTIYEGYTITYAPSNSTSSKIKDIVSNDEYLDYIVKNDFLHHAGDLYAWDDKYGHTVVQSLLNMKSNVFDWTIDNGVDALMTASKNEVFLKKQNDKYKTTYFKDPKEKATLDIDKERVYTQYSEVKINKKKVDAYTQFAVFGELDSNNKNRSTLSSTVYEEVLKKELEAGSETVCVDLDATYMHLCLGDVFTISGTKYVVTRVECTVDVKDTLETETTKLKINDEETKIITKAELKQTSQLHFRIYGLKAVQETFYPAMLPSGHARLSNPQLAVVKDTFDPKHNARYRIQYTTWNDNDYSPWIPVSHEMMSKNSGSVWQLEKDTVVVLNYKDGNVERPYIVGALQTEENKASRATYFNNMDLCTPAGHAIRLTDGYGAGAANFISNFFPLVSWCKGWCPDGSAWHNKSGSWEMYKAYEGGVEITDKFGIYSIKASTDDRNVSIKSPFGDVNLNAFTGITISAPNGDVRIVGKNVSIEAGNKLTLESGKNIHNALLGGLMKPGQSANIAGAGASAAAAVGRKLGNLCDLSLFRHVFEVFLRPVDGTLEIKSNRYLFLEAGNGEASIHHSLYAYDKKGNSYAPKDKDRETKAAYCALIHVIDLINSQVDMVLDTIENKPRALTAAKMRFEQLNAKAKNYLMPNAKTAKDIIDREYNNAQPQRNPAIVPTAADFATGANQNPQEIGNLVAAAYALAQKANDYYYYIYQMTDTNKNPFAKNSIPATSDNNPSTMYNDEVKTHASSAVRNGRIQITDFDPNANQPFDFKTKRKVIKQEWFKAVYTALIVKANFPFKTVQNNGNKWDGFINSLAAKKELNTPWYKALSDPIVSNFTSFAEPVKDRQRWFAGQQGQLIISDNPTSSIIFETDGTPKRYANEVIGNDDYRIKHIQRILHDWD